MNHLSRRKHRSPGVVTLWIGEPSLAVIEKVRAHNDWAIIDVHARKGDRKDVWTI